jgi:anti-sigma factor RsiW
MTNKPDDADVHDELRHLLEVHGADRNRWPAAGRLKFASVIATDPAAHQTYAEFAALDRLLDKAPSVSIERERALARRIMEAAARPPLPVLVPIPASARPVVARAHPSWAKRPAPALMAASLMFGLIFGFSGLPAPAYDAVAELIGLSDSDTEIVSASDVLHGDEEAL